MVDRVIFAPERMPLIDPRDTSMQVRWHSEQWQRLGNYISALEDHIAGLEARIAALET